MLTRKQWRRMTSAEKDEAIHRAAHAIQARLANQEPHTVSSILDRDYQEAGDHYTQMHIQPWDVIDQGPLHEAIGYYKGNALKYLMRFGSKRPTDAGAPLEDAKKARHYVEKLISVLEST